MNPIEFIYQLLARFAIIEDVKRVRLQQKAMEWYSDFLLSENPTKKKIAEFLQSWYFETGLAVFFIYACKKVQTFMNDDKEEQYEEYEEEEDEDDYRR